LIAKQKLLGSAQNVKHHSSNWNHILVTTAITAMDTICKAIDNMSHSNNVVDTVAKQ